MDVEQLRFPAGDAIPNNPRLPALAYRGVLAGRAAEAERVFTGNGWGGTWRSTVLPYHHFHSTSHEALGVAAGRATLALGGPQGHELQVSAGDVLGLPAGTGHKRVDSSDDFLVVGAYPRGQHPDMCRADADSRDRALANIAAVALPEADPVTGRADPLLLCWREAH